MNAELSNWSTWLVVIIMGLSTYGLRAGSILLAEKLPNSRVINSFLKFVPPAVLSAIIFAELLVPSGNLDLSLANSARLAAALGATLVAMWTRKVFPTILAGMALLWLLRIWF